MLFVYPDKEYIREYKDWMKTTQRLLSDLSHIIGTENPLGERIIEVQSKFSLKCQRTLEYIEDIEFNDRKSYCTGYHTGVNGEKCEPKNSKNIIFG